MKTPSARFITRLALLISCTFSPLAFAHGDVTPQSVDTKTLPPLGEQWREENPYRSNKEAIRIGNSAFAQNCARCHGLQAVSGGIAPDLRLLDRDCLTQKDETKKQACFKEIDGYFSVSAKRGKTRNGAVYMPPFEGILNQEAVWSIKAYLETLRVMPVVASAQATPKPAVAEKANSKKKL